LLSLFFTFVNLIRNRRITRFLVTRKMGLLLTSLVGVSNVICFVSFLLFSVVILGCLLFSVVVESNMKVWCITLRVITLAFCLGVNLCL